MTLEQKIQQLKERFVQKFPSILGKVGEEAVIFSRESFEKEAWIGNNTENWKKRKHLTKWGKIDETRPLLMKSAALKRSIRMVRISNNVVYIGAGAADIPYAKTHNYGFKGRVNQNVDAFTRKMKNGKEHLVKAHTRTIYQNIPKRQFIGSEKDSPYLKMRIKRVIKRELNQIIV